MIASRPFTSAVAAGAALVFLVSWTLAHRGPLNHDQIVDTPLYETYGNAMETRQIPYRDFRLEYPPGALPIFLLWVYLCWIIILAVAAVSATVAEPAGRRARKGNVANMKTRVPVA